MPSLNKIVGFLDKYLKIDDVQDSSWNGLQFEGGSKVEKIAFAVDASAESFEKAAQELKEDSQLYEGTQKWRDHLAQMVRTEKAEQKPYGARVKLGMGHTSNALGFSTDTQLPGGVSDESTFFYEAQGFAW